MKSRKKIHKKADKVYEELSKIYTPEEIVEAYIFPASDEQRERGLEAFRQYRRELEANRTEKDRLIMKLLQLKFQIEDVIKSNAFDKEKHFGFFLKEYISCLEKKNKEFADEVDVDPTELSLFINRRRDPPEKFIIRLEIHSNKNFPAIMWYKLLEKEKEHKLIYNQALRQSELGHVKTQLPFSL
jgi:hypothetical protein